MSFRSSVVLINCRFDQVSFDQLSGHVLIKIVLYVKPSNGLNQNPPAIVNTYMTLHMTINRYMTLFKKRLVTPSLLDQCFYFSTL